MKFPPVEAEIFHAVRQADIDVTKIIVCLRKFAKAPKCGSVIGCELSTYNVTDYVINGWGSNSHRSFGNWLLFRSVNKT